MLSLQQMLSQQDTEFSNTVTPRSINTGFLLFIMYIFTIILHLKISGHSSKGLAPVFSLICVARILYSLTKGYTT